jgi:hypothetical protein
VAVMEIVAYDIYEVRTDGPPKIPLGGFKAHNLVVMSYGTRLRKTQLEPLSHMSVFF